MHKRRSGYAVSKDAKGHPLEWDTFTCCHCGSVTFVEPKKPPPGAYCSMCASLTCARCAATGQCDPFEKKLQRVERRNALLRACRAR